MPKRLNPVTGTRTTTLQIYEGKMPTQLFSSHSCVARSENATALVLTRVTFADVGNQTENLGHIGDVSPRHAVRTLAQCPCRPRGGYSPRKEAQDWRSVPEPLLPTQCKEHLPLDGVVGGDSALSVPSLVECAEQFRTVHVQVHAHRQTVHTNV